MAKHKEILVSVDEFETRVAILEDRRLVEFYIEESESLRTVGNIYLGRIKDVLPGMEACFVDIGLERNAFLYVNEAIGEDTDGTAGDKDIGQIFKSGQVVLVQITRDPNGNKGARLTAQLSLPGRKLVLMPYGRTTGISKRIEGEERERLQAIAAAVCPDDAGVIIRTAAVGATEDELKADLESLIRRWELIQERAAAASPPALIYSDLNLAGRVIRDIFTPEYTEVTVDDEDTAATLRTIAAEVAPELVERIRTYKGKQPLFNKSDIDSQVESALKRKVWLRSGGYIAIDRTEALTAVDVNTAKYTGGKNLEQTIYKTNLEAADEIARQLRLRDIGGIIVIDFIDMVEPAHREALFEAFSLALANDRTKSRVIEISRLGLVEMTRKNMSDGIKAHFYEPCSLCGDGMTISANSAAIKSFRQMKRTAVERTAKSFVFEVEPDVAEWFEAKGWVDQLNAVTDKLIYLFPAPGLERGEVTIAREGSPAQVKTFLHGRSHNV